MNCYKFGKLDHLSDLCRDDCTDTKAAWDKTAGKITVAEIVSMGIGVVIAVVAKINFLAGVVDVTQPVLLYLLYILAGVALGRGPSFVHDIWTKVRGRSHF